METFGSFTGMVTAINDFWADAQEPSACMKLMSLRNRSGDLVNFVVEPSTYFVNRAILRTGDIATGFYDLNAPTPMIFPPQYRALVMAKNRRDQTIKVDYFDTELISGDGTLQLTPTFSTRIFLTNGQPFTANPANRNLIVVYGASTRSIPAQTTPHQIIVLC